MRSSKATMVAVEAAITPKAETIEQIAERAGISPADTHIALRTLLDSGLVRAGAHGALWWKSDKPYWIS